MAQQATSFVQEGVDRLHAARERIDEELQRVQRELQARRKRLERRIDSGRKSFERQTRKQVQQLRDEVSRSPLVKRFEELRAETTRVVEGALEGLLGAFQIASKADVDKIDRKLSKINKKLKDLERTRSTNGQHPHAQA
jgi:cell fate (sporulation/competence/biofilm development) regulator YmcA (YheA/YmcA/DUF963 family)